MASSLATEAVGGGPVSDGWAEASTCGAPQRRDERRGQRVGKAARPRAKVRTERLSCCAGQVAI